MKSIETDLLWDNSALRVVCKNLLPFFIPQLLFMIMNAWNNVLVGIRFASTKAKSHYSGRASRGVFAGKDIGFGNNVSFSKRRY